MSRLSLLPLPLLMLSVFGVTGSAEQPIPADHCSVEIVFVIAHESKPGMMQRNSPQALVKDLLLPVDSIRPISIEIDDEFVGHAMVGYSGVKPIFVLPSGTYAFQFTCQGFKPYKSTLRVVGSGSKQYLIVKMETLDERKEQTAGAERSTDAGSQSAR